VGWFPLESVEPWLMDSAAGPVPEHGALSGDTEQSPTSPFSSRSPHCFLIWFIPMPVGEEQPCLPLERNTHPCLSSIPGPRSTIRTGTREMSYQCPLFPHLLLKYFCSVLLILQPWYQTML